MMTIFLKIITVLGFIIFILLAVIIVIEFLLRLQRKNINELNVKNFFPKDYHEYIKYYQSWDKAMFKYIPIGLRLFNRENKLLSKVAKINSLGFRDKEFRKKKKNEYVIIFLGGSAAFGCGASSNKKIISYKLNEILQKKIKNRKKIRVYNLAQINNFQTQDIINLVFFAKKLKPDLAIILNGWNEMLANNIMNTKYLKGYNVFNIVEMDSWQPPAVNSQKFKNLMNSLIHYFENKLYFVSLLNFVKIPLNKRDRDRKSYRNFEKTIKVGADLYVKNLELIQTLSEAFNFKVLTFLQPYISLKRHLTREEKKIIEYNEKYNELFKGENFIKKLYLKKNIYKILKNQIDQKKTRIYDLSNIFYSERKQMYNTLVHLNDLGYSQIAKKIADIVVKNENNKLFN